MQLMRKNNKQFSPFKKLLTILPYASQRNMEYFASTPYMLQRNIEADENISRTPLALYCEKPSPLSSKFCIRIKKNVQMYKTNHLSTNYAFMLTLATLSGVNSDMLLLGV